MSTKRDLNLIFSRRAVLLAGAGGAAMGIVGLRMAYLQTLDPTNYREASDENRFDTRIIAPARGTIYDRNGTILANTSRDYLVRFLRGDMNASEVEATLARVAQILEQDEGWVRRRLNEVRAERRFTPVTLQRSLTWGEFTALNVHLPELRGISAEAGDVRRYPLGEAFAHPIGYVQKPTERDIARVIEEGGEEGQRRAIYLRNPDVRVGKAGLEIGMESQLHGLAGWRQVEVNAAGRVVSEVTGAVREPVQGAGVVLTIDAELQRTAVEAFGDEAGSAIVMDITNGDLLVMASAPGFDPNLFVNGIDQANFDRLNLDEKHPLYHKAVTGTYAPGSTFKMMVGIAARQAGMPEDWAVSCPGYFPFGGRNFHCWRRGGHGRVDMHAAIKGSCDVFFYRAALYAGADRIANVARAFGFGRTYEDLQLPSMRRGIVPDPAWFREAGRGQWTDGLTVNFGIGQGDLQVTPIQLAVMAARLANGRAVMPRLVREAPGQRPAQAPGMVPDIDPAHLAAVRQGMYGVSNEGGGTAISASNLGLVRHPETRQIVPLTPETARWEPVRIAGKTGTAQVRAITDATRGRHYSTIEWRYRDHGLFVCFGPWDEPRYACAVVVEHGGAGSSVAGPISRAIMRETLLRDPANRAPARLAQLEAHIRRPA
ncbi:MAG: penicillin-binding protein 2 [Hyphomonadaceae bacterium]